MGVDGAAIRVVFDTALSRLLRVVLEGEAFACGPRSSDRLVPLRFFHFINFSIDWGRSFERLLDIRRRL